MTKFLIPSILDIVNNNRRLKKQKNGGVTKMSQIKKRVGASIKRLHSAKKSKHYSAQSNNKSKLLTVKASAIEALKRINQKQHKSIEDNQFVSLAKVSSQFDGKEDTENYGSNAYWNSRFKQGKDIANEFEWFLSYKDVEPLLRNAINYDDRTAMFIDVGCGTSLFLRDLKQSGYLGPCIGVDFSENAIQTMKSRADCGGIDFKVWDATEVHHLVKGASVVLDKSLMDTLMHNEDEALVKNMLHSIAKSLKPDGRLIQITQLDPRKEADMNFLESVVLKNLRTSHSRVFSVTAHLTTVAGSDKPVPSVLFYDFRSGPDDYERNVNIDLIEYEPSDDGNISID
jgi:SAM-dependent methyltransferase